MELVEPISVDSLITRLETLDFGVEISFFPYEQNNESLSDLSERGDALLEFDSIYELELFIRAFVALTNANELCTLDVVATAESQEFMISPFSTNRSRSYSWWAPLPAIQGITTWRNIQISYQLAGANIPLNVSLTNSWISGFQPGITWTHRGQSTPQWERT
ncbi:MAG: hypothetical protein FWC66_03180 [Oscillospiraceae bacterium]|nr:hypothetical protein [Oscillospiraceae bacterium]